MQRRTVLILLLVVVVVLGALGGPVVVERIKRGARLTNAEAPSGGFVAQDPKVLAAQAGANVDVYTLARILASESASGSEAERIAVAWIVRNEARARGVTLTQLATTGKTGQGYYGAQNAGGRYVSTRLDPHQADLDLAQKIFNGELADNTGGARKYLHSATQDALAKKGLKGYTKTAADVIKKWTAEGWDLVVVPGVPRDRFVAFRKRAGALVS